MSFFLSAKVNVPLVIGFFKPVVLFPVAMASQLEFSQVEAILIHELSHVRRNDYLFNLVKTLIETMLFFNPFVWLTSKLIHIEREHACDDLVISTTKTPITYAHALLKMELLKDKQTPALSLAVIGKNQHLYQRIKRITNMKTNYINVKQQALILTLAISTIVSLAWINPAKKETKIKPAKANKELTILQNLDHKISLRADTDTTKAKIKKEQKVKIVVTDNNGKENVYTSTNDLPDSLKSIFGSKSFRMDSLYGHLTSPDFQLKMDKMGKDIEAKFNSPEFKAKIEKMTKAYDSPEFKAKMEKMAKAYDSPEFKAKMENMAKAYDSPEFKAKIENMTRVYTSDNFKKEMERAQSRALELGKKYNSEDFKRKSDQWKKQSEEMKKLQSSSEYKKLREKYEKDLEKLKKKNGINTDKALNIANVENLFAANTAIEPLALSVVDYVTPLSIEMATAVAEPISIMLKQEPAKSNRIEKLNIKLKPATTLDIKATETTKPNKN